MNKIIQSLVQFVRWVYILPIKFYKYALSPYLPNSCRHVPSCSVYAMEAIKTHGIFIGTYYGIRRILRCHPWGTSGFDPVPPKKQKEINKV